MRCGAYLKVGLIKKGGIGLFQISQKTFSSLMKTNCSWGLSHNMDPHLVPSKKGLLLLFRLTKKRKYLDTELKGELTLF